MIKIKSSEVAISVAISILFFILSTASFFAIYKNLRLPHFFSFVAFIGGAILSFYIVLRLASLKRALLALACASFFFIFSLCASNIFFDFTPDGTAYHQEAILESSNHFDFLKSSFGGTWALYTNYYPKLSWFYGAFIYDITGNIHYAKSINFLLIVALWLTSYSVLTNLRRAARIAFSTVLAINPVIVTQLFTHYVDGTLGAFLSVAVLGLYGFCWSEKSADFLAVSIAGVIGCASLKNTGFVFSSIMVLGAAYLVFKRGPISFLSIAKPSVYIPILIIALLLTTNPYFKNVLEGKHIFYPSMGKGRIETLISGQTTKQFYEADRFSKLLMSVFGRTENENPKVSQPYPTIKIPFTVVASEIEYSRGVDVRWGGWGPLFGGVFLIASGLLVFQGYKVSEYASLIFLLALLSVINPESWWARFNPQLYVFVVLALLFFYIKNLNLRLVVWSMLIILMINSCLIFNASYKNVRDGNRYIEGVIKEISDNGARTICWNLKTTHLEPIFSRLEIVWSADARCLKASQFCKDLLGEKICRLDSF